MVEILTAAIILPAWELMIIILLVVGMVWSYAREKKKRQHQHRETPAKEA